MEHTVDKTVKSTSFEGIKIAYETHGAGDAALVFVHGWTCSRALWLYQAPLYTKYRSILVDLPGHGESDKPEDVEYNLELFARSVRAVLQAEEVHRIVLVGHSMGGSVSTMVLRLFPELVAGIVYLDSFWQIPESYLTIAERRELAARRRVDANYVQKINELFAESTSSSVREMVCKVMLATPIHVRISACTTDALAHPLPWETSFAIPALHLCVQGVWIDQYWYHHMPQLQVRELPGVGHFLFLEDPETVNAEVERFIVDNKLF